MISGNRNKNTVRDKQRFWYEQGWSFSLIRRYTVSASGVLDIVFDPTAFTGSMMEFNAVQFITTGGSFEIDYYVGTDEDGDGTPQVVINRLATSIITPQSIITEGATVNVPGFNYFQTLTPGTVQTGADSSVGLPVQINTLAKYLLRATNNGAQQEDIIVDATFFEVP